MNENHLIHQIEHKANEQMERLKEASRALRKLEKAGMGNRELRLKVERLRSQLKALQQG